ncbi:MAG: amino acid permease [Patescibacteria group bacterium]|nr:amino acid permease [Patescibacteria group bacterium]
MFKKIIFIFLIILALGSFYPDFASAQYGLEEGQKIQGLSQSSPEIFVGTIIKTILLVIGIILIVLIIYGGFTYATALGNEQKIETGKKILLYAIIGIIIISLAYGITTLIINAVFPEDKMTKSQTQDKTQGLEQTLDDLHGTNITTNPLDTEACKQEGEKCLFSPEASVDDGTLQIQGTAPVNICCSGLDCNISTQTCIKKCANNGESYVKETLVKREYLPCCPGLRRNQDNQTCEKPQL